MRTGFLSLGLVALLAVPSCSSPPPAEPATFTAIYPLFFPRATKGQCNFCHGLPSNEISNGKLAMGMDKASAYAALVGKTSTSTKCGGRPLVVAKEPDKSLFFLKLDGSPPCGGHMPLGGSPLPGEQLDMVQSWIAAGAKDD